jgi:glycosyltransferase involved in cell wall biosynthesis
MRILLSAFGFGPGEGSESGGAWRWAVELAKSHDVVVVTDGAGLRRIGALVDSLKPPRLTVLYYRPSWIRWMKVSRWTSQFIFGQWQLGLLFYVRRLHREQPFDLCQHISYGVFRQASLLGFAGPKFVFGPVGGGEDAPWRLKQSIPFGEKLREAARALVNHISICNPLWRLAVSKADLVIARTPETKAWFPRAVQERTFLAQEIGSPTTEFEPASCWQAGETIELLFAGRLLGLKGVQFAIPAVHELRRRGHAIRLTVVGNGVMKAPLAALVQDLKLDAEVKFIPFLPQQELFALYAKAHVFVFPSLRDSGGNVVLEALAAGLPVVCLGLGGPPCFVDASCGVVVPARDASEAQLVQRLADGIEQAIGSREHWQHLHKGALLRSAELSWEKQIARIQARIQELF